MNPGRAATLALPLALAGCETVDGPVIDRLEPSTAGHGDLVTARGHAFCGPDRAGPDGACTSAPSGAVDLGLALPMSRAAILSWTDEAIAFQVPATVPSGASAVIVTVDGRSSNAATLQVNP